MGLPYPPVPERQAALEEAIRMMRGAWGLERFTFHGQHFRTEGAHVRPAPVQQPWPPLLIAGGGERVTLRQVAQYGDACNFIAFEGAGGVRTPDDVRHKLAALRQHCEALGRPFDTILRTQMTGWLLLAENGACLQEKLAHYFPQGIEERFSGAWRGFGVALTPEQAVPYYQALADAGIQYFVIETLDPSDQETLRLFAERVAPRLRPQRGNT